MSLVILPSYSEEISNNDTQQYATGLIEPTEEQLAAFLVPENEIAEVKLNADAIEQIQNEANGPATYDMIPPAEPGHEVLSKAELVAQPQTLSVLEVDALPNACDNSKKKNFPSIGNQLDYGSCTSWSVGYYQLTNNTRRIRENPNISNMSPAWIYNLAYKLKGASYEGTSFIDAGQILYTYGSGNASFSDNAPWPSNASVWEKGLENKINRMLYIDISDNGSLERVKRLLLNGDVISFSTYAYSFVETYRTDNSSNEKVVVGLNGQDGYHAMTIVGYNDNVVANGQRGAFKVANSWGAAWGNSGYIWITYDAFLNGSLCPDNLFYYVEPRISYTPLILAELSMSVRARNQLGITIFMGDLDEIPIESRKQNIIVENFEPYDDSTSISGFDDESVSHIAFNFSNQSMESVARSLDGRQEMRSGTLLIDLTPYILHEPKTQQGDGEYRLAVDFTDNDGTRYENSLTGLKIIDKINNQEYVSESTFPMTVDGTTATAYADFQIIPKIVEQSQTVVAQFNNDIPDTYINAKNIYGKKIVKTSTRYGEEAIELGLIRLSPSRVQLLPPLLLDSQERSFQPWTYYRTYFSRTISTEAGNMLGAQKKLDYFVTN